MKLFFSGRRRARRGIFGLPFRMFGGGIVSSVLFGLASMLARKLWQKKNAGAFGLREAYGSGSEWSGKATGERRALSGARV